MSEPLRDPRTVTELPSRLTAIHRELKIPTSYAVDRRLPLQTEAVEALLVDIGVNPDGRVLRLTADAAQAWRRMREAAAAEKIELIPISAFRSIDRQAEIIRGKLASGVALDEILRLIAAPGFSEHHTGRAIDIASPEHIELDENFARTVTYKWLEHRAREFGFYLSYPRGNSHGIGYEPWHWCWDEKGPRRRTIL